MTHSYELNESDILEIIAEKFNCKPEFVNIRSEKEHIFGGSTEKIKATVNLGEENGAF